MLRFLVLGPLEARLGERTLEISGGKPRALLSLLLLHAGEVVAAERLVEDLWSGRPPASAAKLVQGYVSQLRRALGSDAVVTVGPGYVLRTGETDVAEFERLVQKAEEAKQSPGQAVPTLRRALALWRGGPFADVAYEPWAQVEIARLEEMRLAAVEELIERRIELGEAGQLVPELEARVREHPLRERLWSQLMLTLYRCDRQADALDAFRHARQALVDELGIEPTRRLRELEQAILRQDPALDPVEAPSTANAQGGAFVGRERELEELCAGLDDAFRSRGRLFLLQGEPGIGKSRLAAELIGRARARGASVLIGRCWEAGGAPAFWPWVQSLRSLVDDVETARLRDHLSSGAFEVAQLLPELRGRFPELTEPLPVESEGARFRLFEAVTSFLRNAAKERPILLLLDDLHAADEPSLILLQFLARELADSRLLILAAYRDLDPTLREPLVDTLAELEREPQTRRIILSGLAKPEVAQYIELVSGQPPSDGVVAVIDEQAEGNPFFLGEIARLLMAEGELARAAGRELVISPSARDVITRRLRRLSEECNAILGLASVLGREFGVEELSRLAGLSHDDVLALLEEAIVEMVVSDAPKSTGGRLRFRHVLIRDALYAELGPARRASLHRRAGEALETVFAYELDAHLSELAHHFLAAVPADSTDKAIEYASRAGDNAARLLAFEEASRLYDTALELVREDQVRASLLERWARIAQQQERLQQARAALEEAADLYRNIGKPLPAARVLTALSNVLWRAGDPSKNEVLTEALVLLQAEPPGPELVAAFSEMAGHHAYDTAYSQAIAAAEQALDLAQALGRAEPARALGYRGLARATLGQREGLDDIRKALRLAIAQSQWRAAAVLHDNLATASWLYEGPRAALTLCEEGIDFSRRHGIDEWDLYIASARLRFLEWCGRPEEALDDAEPLAQRAEAAGDLPVVIMVRAFQLRLSAQRGDGAGLLSGAEQLVATARENHEPNLIAPGFAAPAQLFLSRGKPENAHALLAELEQVPGIRDDPNYVSALPEMVRCALAADGRELAHQLVAGVDPRTPLFAHALCAAEAQLTEAADGHAEALSLYAEAAERWQAFENVPERAYALLGHGRCLVELKQSGAEAYLAEARELFAKIGYKPADAHTKRLLA
ncbi:MAG TPA: BTAD domain-containing putative transcriptional regulator [Myxococcota bacterium]|nr:BTAD domain-containing putative transcriptional regulator [Myxococcota bacterium]